jgi:tetratricopeptide (TPR) repeat protein
MAAQDGLGGVSSYAAHAALSRRLTRVGGALHLARAFQMEPNQPLAKDPESAAGRLDSWKEIAVYLRRDVRTVQRWHDRAGLPVHRHIDPKQRGVFAFQSELDTWANQFRANEEDAPQPADPTTPGRAPGGWGAWWLLAGGLLCAVIALATWTVRHPFTPSAAVHQRAWVLVADLSNQTEDRMLDESLHFALERELSASSVIAVVPRLRLQDDFRLMRRAEDSRITAALAREVAIRDGNVQAIVAARADSAGAGYLLTIQVIDPQTGAVLRSETDQVSARQGLLAAIRRLATWARGALGETQFSLTADSRLPQVTTSSLSALEFYAKAQGALSRNYRHAARMLLEAAIREDPEFALAHSQLARVLVNEPDADSAAAGRRDHAERALALSSKTTEKERLVIVANYYEEYGETEKAVAALEALIRIDPVDSDARTTLAGLYRGLRRIPEAVQEMERAATLRPNDFTTQIDTAHAWAVWADQPQRARPYVAQSRQLWPGVKGSFSSEVGLANLPPFHARNVAWMLLFPAYERWRAGDVRAMLTEVQRVLDSDPLPAPADRDALLMFAMSFQMTAGRLRDAQALAERMSERSREAHLGVLADALDDIPALRRHMPRTSLAGEGRPFRLVRAGRYREADEVIARLSHDFGFVGLGDLGFLETARGELALRRGHIFEGMADLQRGLTLASAITLSERYLGAESLAGAFERLNRKDEAVKVLEAAAQAEPRYTHAGPSGAFWLRVLNRLSEAYRDRGRLADADAVDARLRKLLVLADPDHPLVIQLRGRGE